MNLFKNLVCLLIIVPFLAVSCNEEDLQANLQEDEASTDSCGCESVTIKVFEDIAGTVHRYDGFYLIKLEDNNRTSIESCEELPEEYKVEGLLVQVSGELKKKCPRSVPNMRILGGLPFKVTKITAVKI
ncbi:MAG: hypothetical protein ACLFT3_18145 [Cyclobacteriaceae bacterium]